ncbi:kinase-like domain-containing protein [Glomus cerebriforme]|uniref:Kinase-like domain-containing protein n=1 Tax=Glomus cerebriforme TaxID=658196 RepID=A0A397SNM4_9GLOM|nr:kinase-like domain-containing protein [Glomus cerebriforme]
MSTIRRELIFAVINRAFALLDYNIHDDIDKRHEFRKQTILADESLTNYEKTEAIKEINIVYDRNKIFFNEGTKRICENCNQECLATLYCEYCVRNYLKTKFSNWTSGNNDIDNLIQNCQLETLTPDMIVEWIPYNNLENIRYLTKGGCSEIYAGVWNDGHYIEWDSKDQKLKRFGSHKVVLKSLKNVENANQRWFEEAKSHLTICNKYPEIVPCYGLTQNPSSCNYMLVMNIADINLNKYLRNNKQLTWEKRIKIAHDIINSLSRIHNENAIHRDLHSGNILYSQENQRWFISDLGFCGPADKTSNSVYGNLPYIAPEVISGKQFTFASDIYSIGILMWEISSGQPPFANYEHNYYLAMNVINGMRPIIVSGTPLKYRKLIEKCWNANTAERPHINTLWNEISEINKSYYEQQTDNNSEINNIQSNLNSNINSNSVNSLIRNFKSKVYNFEDLPEPRNATQEEQKAYHSIQLDFDIPNEIEDVEIYNNPNFHSEDQNELEIPEGNF